MILRINTLKQRLNIQLDLAAADFNNSSRLDIVTASSGTYREDDDRIGSDDM
jgi:hypothetical protein